MKLFLTAYSRNGQKFAKPRVVGVEYDYIEIVPGANGYTKVIETNHNGALLNTYTVYESMAEIQAQALVAEGDATNILAKNHAILSVDAAGANAAAATDITKYLTEIDTATAATTDGIQLPAATEKKVIVVINTTAITLDVWPQTSENFDGSADDAATTQAGLTRKHYVCLETGEWVVADDYTQ
jgi:hypothetical protein